jgi:hypothetical protein
MKGGVFLMAAESVDPQDFLDIVHNSFTVEEVETCSSLERDILLSGTADEGEWQEAVSKGFDFRGRYRIYWDRYDKRVQTRPLRVPRPYGEV